MQNIRLFNVCEAQRASRRHLNANVLHHPVQDKNLNFNPYIYILYYQSNIPNYLPPKFAGYHWIMKYFICNEVLEQPANENPVHNVVAIREWRHANVDKQRKLLVDIDVTPPRCGA